MHNVFVQPKFRLTMPYLQDAQQPTFVVGIDVLTQSSSSPSGRDIIGCPVVPDMPEYAQEVLSGHKTGTDKTGTSYTSVPPFDRYHTG